MAQIDQARLPRDLEQLENQEAEHNLYNKPIVLRYLESIADFILRIAVTMVLCGHHFDKLYMNRCG